jgi:hypothetical protein
MKEYEFTLKFKFSDPNIDPSNYIDALYEAGCDDALIGSGIKGSIAFDFIRESDSAYNAITSAIRDIKSVIPTLELVEASPDFVGISDLANLIGCSRQNIQKMLAKRDSDYPSPVYGSARSIWHLDELLVWLVKHKNYSIDTSLLEIAKTNKILNIANDYQKLDSDILLKLQHLINFEQNKY